jgi:hypothetical protein
MNAGLAASGGGGHSCISLLSLGSSCLCTGSDSDYESDHGSDHDSVDTAGRDIGLAKEFGPRHGGAGPAPITTPGLVLETACDVNSDEHVSLESLDNEVASLMSSRYGRTCNDPSTTLESDVFGVEAVHVRRMFSDPQEPQGPRPRRLEVVDSEHKLDLGSPQGRGINHSSMVLHETALTLSADQSYLEDRLLASLVEKWSPFSAVSRKRTR